MDLLKIVRENYTTLKGEIDVSDHIVDYMFQERAIDYDDKDEILACTNRKLRNAKLLDNILKDNNLQKAVIFLKALQSNYPGIYSTICQLDEALENSTTDHLTQAAVSCKMEDHKDQEMNSREVYISSSTVQYVKMATESDRSIDILLVGKTGHGKSATGNTILRKEAFISDPTSTSVTSEAQLNVAMFKDRRIVVVDSPGIGDTRRNKKDDILKFIDSVAKALCLNPKGFHVIIFIMKFGLRFTKEEVYAVELIKKIFGASFITKHCILLYTNGDCFDTDPSIQGRNISFDQWLKEQNDINLGPFLDEINFRAILFNNRSKDDNQVTKLIKMIDRLNTGRERYSNEMFQQSQEFRESWVRESERPFVNDELMGEIYDVNALYDGFKIDKENIGCSLTKLEFIKESTKRLLEKLHVTDKETGALASFINLVNNLTVGIESQTQALEEVCKESGTDLGIAPLDKSPAARKEPSCDFEAARKAVSEKLPINFEKLTPRQLKMIDDIETSINEKKKETAGTFIEIQKELKSSKFNSSLFKFFKKLIRNILKIF